MKKLLALALASALTLAPQSAFAFGSVRALGQNGEHEQITRAALTDFQPQTLDQLAGRNIRFGAVGAPDNPVRGFMNYAPAHCDGGDWLPLPGNVAPYPQTREQAQAKLTECRAFIVNALNAAVTEAAPLAVRSPALLGRDCKFDGNSGDVKCRVLENLGLAFHAAQDFYSHSNWVDQPAPGEINALNPPGLGNTGRAQWLDPRGQSEFPDGLISGCYEGVPERLHCTYTNRDVPRVKHAALNKDNGRIANGEGTTPRGRLNGNFARAVAAATDDTRDKWLYVQERIRDQYGVEDGARIICVITRDDTRGC